MRKSTKRTLNKARIFILKLLTIMAGIIFVLSLIALDSKSYLPIITWIISGGWLFLIAYANRYTE